MNRQQSEWQRKFEAQVRKATGDFQAWLAWGDLWMACGCGAHWLTPECGVDCVLTHRQYPDWNLCNWPPEMLKYWDWRNWREGTPPVDYFVPIHLQQINRVECTAKQMTALRLLGFAYECGTLSEEEFADQATEILPGLKRWQQNNLVLVTEGVPIP